MGHTPFGYRIENGVAVIDEDAAGKLRTLYANYLDGMSLKNAANEAGIETYHASAKRLLMTEHYLGDDFYPAIIDQETYDAFEVERQRREQALGRDKRKKKTIEARPAPTAFRMRKSVTVNTDPYKQAEYLYSLIESEV